MRTHYSTLAILSIAILIFSLSTQITVEPFSSVSIFYFIYYQRYCDERSDVAPDAASERRGKLV
jgi:hypothetical protein